MSTIKRVKSRGSRTRDVSPDQEDDATDAPSIAATLAQKLKNKQKKTKTQGRLSFGNEEQSSDGEVFKVKKSNLSRKLVLGQSPTASPGLPDNLDQATISTHTSSPAYTKAYLEELKASTPSTPANTNTMPNPTNDISYDTSFDMSLDLEGAVVESLMEAAVETAIPSASAVSAAKEKRNRLRGTDPAADYISLSVTKADDWSQGPHPESRLMREEDELGEGEEELAEFTGAQERIALGKKARKKEDSQRRLGMIEMIEDAEEEDEETREWELAQIRRAAPVEDKEKKPAAKPTYQPAPIPAMTPIPILSQSIGRITGVLTTLTSSHASHTAALSSLADERSALEQKELEMRQLIEKAERKRGWFTAFREWVESVANFLDEKYPLLEKLEEEHISLLTERHDMISKRRRLDDEDDVALFLGIPPSSEPEVDELGRVLPSSNSNPSIRVARRAARSNRKLLRRSRNQSIESQEEDGYSTDGSLPPSDANDFQLAIDNLEQQRKGVLSDVRAKEFLNPQAGLAKWFAEWRREYEDSYVGAWGGLGLVAAWEFWSRLEMVGWDPIAVGDLDSSRTLDSFDWAMALHQYSRPSNGLEMDENGIEPEIGPGGDMVSSMISQAVIPRLCKIIQGGALDPYSTGHIRRLIDMAEQVEASVEQDGVRFHALLKSVCTVFREAIAMTTAQLAASLGPANPGAPFDPQADPARRRFLMRRLKLLNNLVKWRKYSGERFAVGELVTDLIRSCVLPVAERAWDIGGEEFVRKAIEFTPSELVPAEVTRRLR
ncbi:hypothetical protein Clacol_010040 [Clathrus columnatus]|uniref:Uncharacterized protein n=1 Tax=Clathrus columnatus TaxID=1419009 RepID=A0AAV5APT0_9AGAM|nr:hypothetical protein Clacol_010040 [Clathrus columnatus]